MFSSTVYVLNAAESHGERPTDTRSTIGLFDVAFQFLCLGKVMAIGVVEFSREGYKIRKDFA